MTKLFRILLFSLLLFITLHGANTHQTLNVGILSFRLADENQRIWQPLVDEVHSSNPSLDVNITSGSLDDINALVAHNKLDFVVVHPAAFVEMEYKYGISNIASIVRQSKTSAGHLTTYGGVIVILTSRHDIHSLADIRGKRIAILHS